MSFEKFYNFDAKDASANNDWLFSNPDGTVGIDQNTSARGRRWNWSDGSTPSSGVGPVGPQSGVGYIYTEASSPALIGDKYYMELVNGLDATNNDIVLSFYYSADTDGDPNQLIVEIFDGTVWTKEYDTDVSSTDNTWVNIVIQLGSYTNSDLKIRFTSVITSGTSWHHDLGIDSVRITGTDRVADDITIMFASHNVSKYMVNKELFDGRSASSADVEAGISDLVNNIYDYTNYPNGVMVTTSDTEVVHISADKKVTRMTSDGIDIFDCESVTNAVGRKLVVTSTTSKHNEKSIVAKARIGLCEIGYSSSTTIDLTNKHLRLWYNSITYENADSVEYGGISIYVTDDLGNTAYWYYAGNLTYSGDWINMVIYTGVSPDQGSADMSSIVEVGVTHLNRNGYGFYSNPRTGQNIWLDYIRTANGVTISGDNCSIDTAGKTDNARGIGYGIISNKINVNYIYGSIIIGTTTTKTIHTDDNTVIMFTNSKVAGDLYKISLIGDSSVTSEYSFTNCVIDGYDSDYELIFNNTGISKLKVAACAISNANAVVLHNNPVVSTIEYNIFKTCGVIKPNGGKFTNNVITDTVSTTGAIYVDNSSIFGVISKITFKEYSNKYAVYITSSVTGEITLDAVLFDGSGIDIYWEGVTGTLTVKLINHSNPVTYASAGGVVDFVDASVSSDIIEIKDTVNTRIDEVLAKLTNNTSNLNQLLISLGDEINENQDIVESTSGVKMFL